MTVNKRTAMSLVNNTPNILILADNQETFTEYKTFIKSVVGNNSFTIYNLNTKDLDKSTAWMSNCTLLIDTVNLKEYYEIFSDYLNQGGSVLSIETSDREDFSKEFKESLKTSFKLYPSRENHFITKVNINFTLLLTKLIIFGCF